MKKKAAKGMKTIELKALFDAPVRYHLEFKMQKGIETEREARFPKASAERIWVTSVSAAKRETFWGIVVQLRPRGPRMALVNNCKPVVIPTEDRAKKVARWISNPVGTKPEWDTPEDPDVTAASKS